MLAYIPDNLEQGNALKGFEQPKQTIVGIDDDKALLFVRPILRQFSQKLEHLQNNGVKRG